MPRPEPLKPIELRGKPTNNPILLTINDSVKRYNLVFPTLANQQERNPAFFIDARAVGYLDTIFLNCIAYLVIRPFGSRSARGQLRAQDIGELCESVQTHAAFFNIKFLRADLDNGEANSMNYWLERHDQKLYGDEVFEDFVAWLSTTERRSFRDYKSDASSRIQYFTDLQRSQHEVRFAGKLLVDKAGDLLNTAGTGALSGLNDSFIYICSARTRKLYTAESEPQVVHHSSFMRGEPIVVGGDWVVRQGKLYFLNAASGHYRPTTANMRAFLHLFQGSIGREVLVQPEFKGHVYRVGDYLREGEAAKPSVEGNRFVNEFGGTAPLI